MPSIDLIDESYLVADPAEVAARFHDPALWRSWWPELDLTVFTDRGLAGLRWTVTGELAGSSEVWLEAAGDGVILHYFLRAEPTRPGSDTEPLRGWRVRRSAQRAAGRHATAFKQRCWALKDELEGGRAPGMPRVPAR
ncbi:MAG: polyketide cyclase / dehydrase and lipid transport [Frankiaceae bacterium]